VESVFCFLLPNKDSIGMVFHNFLIPQLKTSLLGRCEYLFPIGGERFTQQQHLGVWKMEENDGSKMLWDVRAVAHATDSSVRKVWAMADIGHLPPPVRLGRSVKWQRATIEAWIKAGCPHVKRTGWTPSDTGRNL
jgi:predicted DNA-binding transcriptional regulator AlpA